MAGSGDKDTTKNDSNFTTGQTKFKPKKLFGLIWAKQMVRMG